MTREIRFGAEGSVRVDGSPETGGPRIDAQDFRPNLADKWRHGRSGPPQRAAPVRTDASQLSDMLAGKYLIGPTDSDTPRSDAASPLAGLADKWRRSR